MSGSMDYIDCPKCGYEDTTNYVDWKTHEKYEFCQRCGYGLAIEGEPGYSLMDLMEDPSRFRMWEERDGIGVFYWEMKEGEEEDAPTEAAYDDDNPPPSDKPWEAPISKFGYAPRQQVRLDKMKSLDKYKYFEVSFEENGKWFLKDLVTGKTRPYDKPCYN